MKHFFIIFFILYAFSLAWGSEYKIIAYSSKKESLSKHKLKQLSRRLKQNPNYHTLQRRYHFNLLSRISNTYYIVVLEPLPTYRIAKQLLKIVHTVEAGAFISKIKAVSLQKSLPTPRAETSPIVENNTTVLKSSPAVIPAKKVPQIVHKKTTNHTVSKPQTSSKPYLITILSVLILMAFWFLLKYLKRATQPIDCNAHLHHSFHDNTEPTLLVDANAPILPGVEHGPKDVHTALNLIEKLEELGFKKLIVTPRASLDIPNKKLIDEGFHILKHALKEKGSSTSLTLAVEYELNETLLDILNERDKIITFNHNYLLCKMSYTQRPSSLINIINTIKTMDYIPVLAHTQRYEFLNTLNDYMELKESGMMFQFDISALITHEDKEKITILTTNHLIDFLSSNAASSAHLEALEKAILTKEYQNLFKENIILNNYLLS